MYSTKVTDPTESKSDTNGLADLNFSDTDAADVATREAMVRAIF